MSTEKKIASLDIGLSTVMLLIASCSKGGRFDIINEFGGISRLGMGLSKTNTLSRDRIEATIDICKEVVDIASNDGAERIIATATSGIKSAINKTQFLIDCRSRFNIFPNILTEQEEARLIYKGASVDYSNDEKPVIVIEVGGDATYVVFGRKGVMIKSHVMKIGSFHAFDNPNKYSGMFSFLNPRLRSSITEQFHDFGEEILSWLEGRTPRVICSGTVASLFYGALAGRSVLSRSSVEGKSCSLLNLQRIYSRLTRKSLEERKKMPGVDAERAQTFPTALYILSECIRQLKADTFTLTANGLRTGILRSYIEKISFWD